MAKVLEDTFPRGVLERLFYQIRSTKAKQKLHNEPNARLFMNASFVIRSEMNCFALFPEVFEIDPES
jgi:hypothetical protein